MNLQQLIEDKMIDFVAKAWLKFTDFVFEVQQFLNYHDSEIMLLLAFIVILLFGFGAKNLALLIALIYIMAKVTK